MTEIDNSVRIRLFVKAWFPAIVLGLVILCVALGWWSYQVNLVPEFEQEERTIEQWTEATDFEHSAVIINESDVWEEGERIHNRPLYYYRVATALDGTYTYEYAAASGDVRVATETHLVVRAIDGNNEDTQVFWDITEPLASTTDESLEPGDSHTVTFSINVTEVLERISVIEEQLGAREGLVDVRVVANSSVVGEVEGDAVDQTYVSELEMVVNPDTYRVSAIEGIDERHETVETTSVVIEPSPAEAYGSILAFGIALVALISVVYANRAELLEVSESERELLEYHRNRSQFAEWITTGTFPAEREYESTVLVDDLEGLVDVAIDSNKRVIEDTQLGVATVLEGDYIYIYVRPDSPARDWLLNFADTTMDDMSEFDF